MRGLELGAVLTRPDRRGLANSMTAAATETILRRTSHSRGSTAATQHQDAPILKIFVPHTGQSPWVAGRPFFMVIGFASLISREALHFTQYPEATPHLHAI